MKDNLTHTGFSTKAIHVGEEPNLKEGGYGDVAMPIHLSTTYARQKVDIPTAGYEYTRSANPTRHALEKKLAALENSHYALAFASGLAAESTLILALLKAGDHVLAFDDLYGGTKRLFNKVFAHHSISISYIDMTHLDNVRSAILPETKLVWIETPTNPLLKLADIAAIASIAKEHNLIVVVDNTFLSPYFQNPLDLGADIVLHSTTKYIGGHSDVLGGAIMLSNIYLYEKLKFHQNALGAVASPFDAYLTMRGIKTLELRMQRHLENALSIAQFLEHHPKVERVIYPGLKSHPQHGLANKQTRGSGGVLSFSLRTNASSVPLFLESLQIFALAESLGGVESLIEHPATMTHASVDKEEREKIGITDTLIRVSVGIENVDDLIEDLKKGLAKIV